MTGDDALRGAREIAEARLDEFLRILRDEMADVPRDRRWELATATVMGLMKQLRADPLTLTVGYVLACERLLMVEELDHDLHPGTPPQG
jgi:hypothetical protein